MTSKEKLQRSINTLNYKKSQNGKLSNVDEARLKCYEEVVKDLEILEEIRNDFKVLDWGEDFQNRYELIYQNWYRVFINKEQYVKWSRWLEDDK